jgi:hypothetical protein
MTVKYYNNNFNNIIDNNIPCWELGIIFLTNLVPNLLISTARPLKYLNILLFKSYNNIISFLGGDCDGGDPGQALQYIAQSGIPDET